MAKDRNDQLQATTQKMMVDLVESAIIPKTGARTRDDFKPKPPEAVPEKKETATAVYLPDGLPGLREAHVCSTEVSRGLLWQASIPGTLLSTTCPDDASGLAMRECKLAGWSRPQLGQCIALWLTSLASSYTSHVLSPAQLSIMLRQKIASKELYGGDIIGVLDLADRLIKNAQFDKEGSDEHHPSLIQQNLANSLSSLLDRQTIPAWLDLSQIELEFQRSRFINLLTDLGLLELNNQRLEHDLNTDNLGGLNFVLNLNLT